MASVYTITTGKTLNTHERFKSHLPWGSCKNVSNSKECDVILAFCPVTSRVGTDIEAALRVIPEGKPLALVVLHHTFDSNYTLPDTKRFVKRPDSITVDCLFNDDGLMRCPCNDGAVQAVAKFLRQHGKRSLRGKLALGLLILILLCVAISTFSNFREQAELELIHTKKELALMQQNYKTLEGKLNEIIKSHKEDVKELNRKANKTINTLQKEVEDCKESGRKANEKINTLQKEVENCTELGKEASEKINSHQEEVENYKELQREANKKMNTLEEKVKNCTEFQEKGNEKSPSVKNPLKSIPDEVSSGLEGAEKQDDKSTQSPSESSQNVIDVNKFMLFLQIILCCLVFVCLCIGMYFLYNKLTQNPAVKTESNPSSRTLVYSDRTQPSQGQDTAVQDNTESIPPGSTMTSSDQTQPSQVQYTVVQDNTESYPRTLRTRSSSKSRNKIK